VTIYITENANLSSHSTSFILHEIPFFFFFILINSLVGVICNTLRAAVTKVMRNVMVQYEM